MVVNFLVGKETLRIRQRKQGVKILIDKTLPGMVVSSLNKVEISAGWCSSYLQKQQADRAREGQRFVLLSSFRPARAPFPQVSSLLYNPHPGSLSQC